MRFSLLAALLAATACSGAHAAKPHLQPMPERSTRTALRGGGAAKSPRIVNYTIAAALDADKKQVTGTETLHWRNDGAREVSALSFHLYMNAFKNEASIFMQESRGTLRSAKIKAGNWGWIDVSSIKLGETELRPAAKFGADETTLEVPLPKPVAPGQEIALDLTFTTQLPEVFARTGYKGEFIMVGQWFPKIGVLTKNPDGSQTWHCDSFHANSEFFADFGVYDVTLTVPETEVVVATGVLTKPEALGDGTRKLTYHAEDVHDFVWMADPYMEEIHTTADTGDFGEPVDVYVYARPTQRAYAKRHLEAARRTIESFSKVFYPYPWPTMTVIDPPPDAAAGAGGMEYPMVVTTAADHALIGPSLYFPEFVTVHEVGHNWFQGLLASNEVDEAFMDEGVNEYADGIVMEEWHPGAGTGELWGEKLGYYEMHRVSANYAEMAVPIATRSYDFPSTREYGASTYNRTAVALKTLEDVVGPEKFFAAMNAYAHAFAFKHPTREDLFAALSKALGDDVRRFLDAAFLGTGEADFRVGELKTRRAHEPRGVFGDGDKRETKDDKNAPDGDDWLSTVLVMNVGLVPVPVDVEMRFSDGSTRRDTWTPTAESWRWKRFEVKAPKPVVGVVIDPDGKVQLEYERLENGLRTDESSSAAWRAGARASFWEQTAMQVIGL